MTRIKVSAHKTNFLKPKSAIKARGKFRKDAQSRKKVFSTLNKKIHQFHMIKSNKGVTLKALEIYFLYKKLQNPKLAKIFLYSVSRIVPIKNENLPAISEIIN